MGKQKEKEKHTHTHTHTHTQNYIRHSGAANHQTKPQHVHKVTLCATNETASQARMPQTETAIKLQP